MVLVQQRHKSTSTLQKRTFHQKSGNIPLHTAQGLQHCLWATVHKEQDADWGIQCSSTTPVLHLPHSICQPFVVSLLQGQFGMPPPFSLVEAAMMSCQQCFQSYSLGTSGADTVKFNCSIKQKHKIEHFVFYKLNFSLTSELFNIVFNTLN